MYRLHVSKDKSVSVQITRLVEAAWMRILGYYRHWMSVGAASLYGRL
jgi:hypothetical protein